VITAVLDAAETVSPATIATAATVPAYGAVRVARVACF